MTTVILFIFVLSSSDTITMQNHEKGNVLHLETICGSFLIELKKIWEEVGEPETITRNIILELEQECIEVCRRRVDQANQKRAQLRKATADSEAELAYICSELGERPPLHTKPIPGTLKQEFETIISQLEEMRVKKAERKNEFQEALDQIQKISNEFSLPKEDNTCIRVGDENDLSLKRLEEIHSCLIVLQKKKDDRLNEVQNHLNTLKSLCSVLDIDFNLKIQEAHPSLVDSHAIKSISDHTIQVLSAEICGLQELKTKRLEQCQDLATTMVELWTLLDTPIMDQRLFHNITKKIAASDYEITEPNALSLDLISKAEIEVKRLQQLKSSKINEVVVKKRSQLQELCQRAHLVLEAQDAVESGETDPIYLLEIIELQISKAKEEASSRKEILEKVEKWLAACEEEDWLEEYNRDDNRYNAGRGAHLILKRAEKARLLVNKIPATVEALVAKVRAWNDEKKVEFLYDGANLLTMLEQYTISKEEKEKECQRQREEKKLEGKMRAKHEVLYGSKPSPSMSGKKASGTSVGSLYNKRYSIQPALLQLTPSSSRQKGNNILAILNLYFICGRNSEVSKSQTKKKDNRKPLSPLSSSKTNIQEEIRGEKTEKRVNERIQKSSPTKIGGLIDHDYVNRTPGRLISSIPTTPSTISVAMQSAMTPFTPSVVVDEDSEYSFEENRACFARPNNSVSRPILRF
ncbi:65-kDa microtubule-associated protein 9-like [Impatiens glandulifera]|uniref:65-kDa microtubule-associated protein 9-like n=1 Tax=Impatiens glandulifera TaxID=253017 RepID=UPI001FB19E6E|nr:65-kDa microtubule-associated protein 9-like [Impatiens glandulifera]